MPSEPPRQQESRAGVSFAQLGHGRAIVKEPGAFLFDEPLSNLDAALRVQTRLEIARLHHDLGSASMICVTHDQAAAMTLADKIVLLHTAKLIEERLGNGSPHLLDAAGQACLRTVELPVWTWSTARGGRRGAA